MNLNGTRNGWTRTFTGAEVTWAGAHPFSQGLCFGFDDGSLIFTDENAESDKLPQSISESGEPVNGLAAHGKTSLAVSTRADVTFVEVDARGETTRSVYRGGAHGVATTSSGYFISPLGINGLLVVKPDAVAKQRMSLWESNKEKLYLYRVVPLRDGKGNEALIFATRKEGVGICPFEGYDTLQNIHTIASLGVDIVDICEVALGSFAVAAISIDGILMVFNDALRDFRPVTIKLGGIEGTVYRVLSSRGHLFVLTSKALYVWHGLIGGLMDDRPISENVPPVVMPMEAIDLNIYRDSLLLIVMAANEVQGIGIESIGKSTSKPFTNPERFVQTTLKLDWLEHDFKQCPSLASVA